jgi:hypothetical protein
MEGIKLTKEIEDIIKKKAEELGFPYDVARKVFVSQFEYANKGIQSHDKKSQMIIKLNGLGVFYFTPRISRTRSLTREDLHFRINGYEVSFDSFEDLRNYMKTNYLHDVKYGFYLRVYVYKENYEFKVGDETFIVEKI